MDTAKYDEILLALLQGDAAVKWAADQVGWEPNSSTQVCSWSGVKCDPIDLSITEVDVSHADLEGTIPAVFGSLPLRKLHLSHNQFQGTLAPEILALPQLNSVVVSDNMLTGSFPLFLSASLEVLDVMGNKFVGYIPEDIAQRYPAMISLDLSNNSFGGTIPKGLVGASNLNKLNLAFNQFHGVIPRDIGQLRNVAGIFLNDNALYGPIPSSLRELPNLMQLFLQHNQLSGTIPESLSEIHYLKDLFVDGNKLTGVVPLELCNRQLNDKYFSEIPGAAKRNGCESLSCPPNYKSEEGVYPCEQCPAHKYTPYLGWNGQCINVQERHIVEALYQDTSGPEWKNAERWGNPNVPYCMYEGIDCNEAGHIVNITLIDMNLHGQIPAKLGRLAHLRILNLRGNQLTGAVPSDLRFSPLEQLDLSDNQFVGPLPPLLCQTEGINGNGENGVMSCDVIMCASGTWFADGRSVAPGRHCLPCGDVQYLGQSSCNKVGVASVEKAEDYMHTHSWPVYILIMLAVSFGVLAMYLLWARRRRGDVGKESQARLADETYFDEDGVYDANEFEAEQEELAVMQYPTGGSDEEAHLPIDDPPRSPQTPETLRARVRSAPSPDDDPDTQDLWLDVPKIA